MITQNDTFRYLIPSEDPGSWRLPDFNDSTWEQGRSGFGYGDADDSTEVPYGTMAVLMRKTFLVADLSSLKKLLLHVDFDDAFVAYLNGHEIARAEIGTAGTPPAWNAPANSSNHEEVLSLGGIPDAFACDSAIKYLVEGINLFAIEVHNYSNTSSDLSCTPFLSLGYANQPEALRGTPSFLNFSNSYFHLNFKISSSGDTLMLTKPDGVMIDSICTGEIPYDISLGLYPDGVASRWFFSQPTPGMPNTTKAFPILSFTDPVFSSPGGYYTDPFELTLTGAEAGDTIWYTTNGSVPGRDDLLYSTPVYLSESKVIRAIILGEERMNRKPVTHSYLFPPEAPTLTTISLSTDSLNFFDWDTGIYVMGPNASPEDPNKGANFWMDWERPIHLELFEKNGSLGLEADAGVKIYGAWSRAHAQRSLAFFSRTRYGTDAFRYKFFDELPFTEYNNFILRNSGNDWNFTMIRDALMTGLLDQTNIDRQAYRPASIYLNGEYWGLMNIREKINEHFLAAHHGIDPYQIDLLEGTGRPLINTNYEEVKTMMDVENFMEYQLAEIYFNNTDWPGNNIKFWRPRTSEGRWRWIIFDTDFGFYMYDADQYAYTFNTLAFALATVDTSYANSPASTFLLRRLLENRSFKYEFINRFADRLNSVFNYTYVLQRINQMSENIEAEMPYHYAKWTQWGEGMDFWNYNLEKMRNFALERVPYMRLFISEQFGNIGYSSLKITTSSAQSGTIKLNTLNLESFPWEGTYFKTVPVQLTASAKTGYRFVNWEGPVKDPFSPSTTITLTGPSTVKAVFEADGSSLNDILINEIYYNDPPDFDADDWVEIYNKGIATINLSGWILKDEEDEHRFVIPEGTWIDPKEYMVFSRDTSKYALAYPERIDPIGEFDFGLGSTGDCVRLFTADSILVDTVRYGVSAPWPSAPNDYGTSIELINPGYDNSMAIHWTESMTAHGTPGEINSLYTGIKDGSNSISTIPHHLLQSYPNPFSFITTIRYEISERESVKITVVDLHGNVIATLQEGEVDSGIKEVSWDGCGTNGKRLPPGIYICTLQTRNSKDYLRLVVL
jgi:hypothetical protein